MSISQNLSTAQNAMAAPEAQPAAAGGHKPVRWPGVLVGLSIFACSLCLRLTFVGEVIEQGQPLYSNPATAAKAGFITNDSEVYLQLARQFFDAYFGSQLPEYALLRTPGYPAFCQPFLAGGSGPAGILIGQAVLGACIPVLTLVLALLLTRGNIVLSGLAGLLSALCPTGIGLCGLVMSDMLFAALMAAGLAALYGGAVRQQPGLVICSGLVFSATVLVKPILQFWPLAMPLIYGLFCRGSGSRPAWKALAIAVALQALTLGLWCTRNYASDGVFTVSSISASALHDFMRPRVREWARAGKVPPLQVVRYNRELGLKLAEKETAGLPTAEKLAWLRARSLETFRAYPAETVKVFLRNMEENALASWDYFSRQLSGNRQQAGRLSAAKLMEVRVRVICLFAGAAFVCCLAAWTLARPTAANRRGLATAAALGLVYGYFVVLSGATFWGGSRIMYPVECSILAFTAFAAQTAGAGCRVLLGRVGIFSGAGLPRWAGAAAAAALSLCILAAGMAGALWIG